MNPSSSSMQRDTVTRSNLSADIDATKSSARRLHVLFLHLDWGIGGAEQLMLQLAEASSRLGHDVSLLTSRCDPDHCFALLKPPDGMLYSKLKIRGAWIPAHFFGSRFQALCSTLRLMYLAHCAVVETSKSTPDLIVLDVLPTPLVILRWFTSSALLFYCHFPDRLLIRNNKKGNSSSLITIFQYVYRFLFNWIEERTMGLADTITVNSKFTRQTVLQTFPSLATNKHGENTEERNHFPVLYPALEIPPLPNSKSPSKNIHQVVSLNRFERKKNLELLIFASVWLRDNHPDVFKSMKLIIAGGYDKKNIENVQYHQELETLAQNHSIPVDFRKSISDSERRELLATSAVVAYTPSNEHFGIVPLEAMAAQTPVIAVNNGGPLETVRDGETGLLCDPTPQAFGMALQKILQNPSWAQNMGTAGRQHVLETFGPERLQRDWKELTQLTVETANQRRHKGTRLIFPSLNILLLFCIEILLLLSVFGLFYLLCIHLSAYTMRFYQIAFVRQDEL